SSRRRHTIFSRDWSSDVCSSDLVRESGPLDVLVVNAGIAIFGDSLEQDPDAIDRLFRINIHAPYHAAVEAARRMPQGGRIIVIRSEEHTSELQSREKLVCRLLLE